MAFTQDRNPAADRNLGLRPSQNPSLRRHIHGPIQPMERPGILQRLFGFH